MLRVQLSIKETKLLIQAEKDRKSYSDFNKNSKKIHKPY